MASRTPDQFMLAAVTGNAVGQKKSNDVLTSQLSEICESPKNAAIKRNKMTQTHSKTRMP